jgi:hypothetical protein
VRVNIDLLAGASSTTWRTDVRNVLTINVIPA